MNHFPTLKNLSKRALFIARWDVLIERPERGYPTSLDEVVFRPGAVDALFYAGQLGWHLYLFADEMQVPDGKQSYAQWQAIEAGILDMLRAQGVKIARSYAAVDRVGGVEGHDKESVYATPNTGVMHHARQNDGINLDDSWVIAGDVESLISGWRAGCHTAGVGLPRIARSGPLSVEPEVLGPDLAHTLAALGARPPLRKSA